MAALRRRPREALHPRRPDADGPNVGTVADRVLDPLGEVHRIEREAERPGARLVLPPSVRSGSGRPLHNDANNIKAIVNNVYRRLSNGS
jgi:hypothetical protein